jgi:starch synthase
MQKILFAASEAHPFVKTGGLGDVAGALPAALKQLGCDIRLVLPAYWQLLAHPVRVLRTSSLPLPGSSEAISIIEGELDAPNLKFYLVDVPPMFDRPGGPYSNPEGRDWPDNAERFALFSRAVVELAQDRAGLDWRPDVVHCNDWQTGLVPALLTREPEHPATVFTIHNLAYQGLFDRDTFMRLRLPRVFWSADALEFYGRFSFIKGGLAFADLLTTVSPTYAQEIQTPDQGQGLDGLLRHRAHDLVGILNGVDYSRWDPRADAFINVHYDDATLDGKARVKRALQQHFHLQDDPQALLLGVVTRLAEQKGVDLILEALPVLLQEHVQLVVLGNGDKWLEEVLSAHAQMYAGRMGVHIGFHEGLAHRIVAGADALLMPSRFEPCGLMQMYSLRYGAVPIVRATGGLADTVVHASPENLAAGTATGVQFFEASGNALMEAVRLALRLYREPGVWGQLQRTGMTRDFGWEESARRYLALYQRALTQAANVKEFP